MQLAKVGPWVSVACAIHCMASPILLGMLPMVHASETIESVLIVVSIVIGALTLGAGYREHRRARVLVLLVLSVAFLCAKYVVRDALETPTVMAGALLMAGGQFLNLRLQRHCCRHHHDARTSRSELSSIANRV
jgi:hypothetical protein